MRIALVYDCLYPHTVGGAERWLRALAERLAERHEVTYVTRRQWAPGEEPRIPGVRVAAVAAGGPLYDERGRRRLGPPLRFGLGVLGHFLRHRRRYDVVDCLSYPFTAAVAVRLALAGRRRPLLWVEWIEHLSADYWRAYGGRLGGGLGRLVQALVRRLTPRALAYSRRTAADLRSAGYRGPVEVIGGLWDGRATGAANAPPASGAPLVLFAGRHVPDKGVALVPDALALAARAVPGLRAVIAGDGPERARVIARVAELGLGDRIEVPGFLDRHRLEQLQRDAACVVAPSIREGYGMVVVEAAAAATPVVVTAAPDNAAVELVEPGVNGVVAAGATARAVAAGVVEVIAGGAELRRSTAAWFERNRERLSMERSTERVRDLFESAGRG